MPGTTIVHEFAGPRSWHPLPDGHFDCQACWSSLDGSLLERQEEFFPDDQAGNGPRLGRHALRRTWNRINTTPMDVITNPGCRRCQSPPFSRPANRPAAAAAAARVATSPPALFLSAPVPPILRTRVQHSVAHFQVPICPCIASFLGGEI